MKNITKIICSAILALALFAPLAPAAAQGSGCPDNQLKMPDGTCFSEQIERAERSRMLTALVEYYRNNPDEIRELLLIEGEVVLRGLKFPHTVEEMRFDLKPSVSGVIAASILKWGWGAVAIAVILAFPRILVAFRFLFTGQGYPHPRLRGPDSSKAPSDV